MIGRTLSHYKILSEISRGGMGIVYRALDLKLDREVALKVLPPELVADPERKRRFVQEAKAAAKLEHPHIGMVFEIDEADGTTFIAMELIRGQQLRDTIAKGPVPLRRALEIATDIAEGLAKAHDERIVHRDLKPANIMVTEDGHTKIIDFGLAKLVEPLAGEGSDIETLTRSGETDPGKIMGTVSYMSPEQARGKHVDHRSDIFSFGIVLHEMIAGQTPFKGDSAVETLNAILKEPAPQLSALGSEVTEASAVELQHIVDKCLAKDPGGRYQTMKDLLVDLRAARDLLVSGSTSLVFRQLRRKSWLVPTGLAGIAALAAITGYTILYRDSTPTGQETPTAEPKRIAILTFENLGPPDEGYLTDGITDEIRTRLTGLSGLAVIGRQSSIQYKGTQKTAQKIGEELGADFLLGGTISIRRTVDGVRVRVRPQLTRASDATQEWAEVYDEDITDPFQLETNIAEKVVAALDITLLEAERWTITEKPTGNLEAYQYYLRGTDYYQRSNTEEDMRIAVQMYEKAVELDPDFAVAHARLSEVHSRIYWFFYDRTEERLRKAKEAVDKAFHLESDLPEAQIALGFYHYWGYLNYEKALAEFRLAQRRQPNNSDLYWGIALVQRRRGELEEALQNYEKAAELNPRQAPIFYNIAQTHHLLRVYPAAERYYDRAISLTPDWTRPFAFKALFYLSWQGDTKKARATLEQISQGMGTRDYIQWVLPCLVHIDTLESKYQDALDRLSTVPSEVFETHYWYIPKDSLYAQIYGLMNQPGLERAHYDSARALLESRSEEHPEDSRLHSAVGIAYAGLGSKEEAIREGKLAVELLPITKEAFGGLYLATDLARIYAMVDESDAAIDQLEHLLSIPGFLSVPLLRLDPIWEPLRGHPRFQRLVGGES